MVEAVSYLISVSSSAVTLADFISTLLQEGSVTVAGNVVPFDENDLEQTAEVLREFHAKDLMDFPGQAPAFDAAAATWAAVYLYRAVQLLALRNLGEDVVKQLLTPYEGQQTAEAIYSVDLCFRYVKDVLELAKGLAPGDILVVELKHAAAQWPFSSVGMGVEAALNINGIMNHSSLKYSYIDRIIATRDLARCKHKEVKELVREAMGNYASEFWIEFK